jgi:hypothetical protein
MTESQTDGKLREACKYVASHPMCDPHLRERLEAALALPSESTKEVSMPTEPENPFTPQGGDPPSAPKVTSEQPSEQCRFCGRMREQHQRYGAFWLCPPNFGTSTQYVSLPQFVAREHHQPAQGEPASSDDVIVSVKDGVPAFARRVINQGQPAQAEPGTPVCTHCGQSFCDAMRFCSNCWNDLAIKHTVAVAKARDRCARHAGRRIAQPHRSCRSIPERTLRRDG